MDKSMLARCRSPIGFLTIAMAMSISALAMLAWYSYDAYHEGKVARERDLRVEQLRGKIVHLDEVLTMSARMAAASGDLSWEDRYRGFEPELEAAINEALVLAPDAHGDDAAAETDEANIRLVEMENRAFELVRDRRPDEAKAILFSDEYNTQKRIYARGMAELSDSLSNALEAGVERSRQHALVDTAAAVLLAPLLILGWVVVLRATRRWQATSLENSCRLTRQTEELSDINRTLDQRIRKRTEQLRDSQAAALNMMQDAEEARSKAEQSTQTLRAEVTRRQQMEEELRDSEAKFRGLYESTSDAVMLLADQSFFDCNEAALRVFGCSSRDEFLTKHPGDLSPPTQPDGQDSHSAADVRIAAAFRDGSNRFDWMHRRVDGTDFPAEVLLNVMMLDGRNVLQAVVRDISERKRSEEALKKHTHDLDLRVKELKCLYGISRMIEDGEITAEETIRKMLALIPPSWQYPEVTCARFLFDGKAFETDNFEETLWKQSSAIFVGERLAGALEVCYLREMPQDHEGPFLKEERALIDGITERIGTVLQRQEMEAEAAALKQQIEFILGATKTGLHIMDTQRNMRYVDPQWQELYGDPAGQTCCDYFNGHSEPCGACGFADALKTKKIVVAEKVMPKEDRRPVQVTSIPFQNEQGEWLVAQVMVDITERKRMEAELIQAQKLESIGQLAAGIAHEINTPSQYIGDNTRFLKEAFEDIDVLLGQFDRLLQAAKGGQPSDTLTAEVEAAVEEADLEYLAEEIPNAIRQSQEGVTCVATIVRAMKEFSHPGGEQKQSIDLNRAIENTVTVSRNEWKYVADLTTDFDPALPPVPCHSREINQVILNIIVNAAQAIGEDAGESPERKGAITIRSRHDGDFAEIRITDTGPGIPEEARSRVFDHFFTTKEVGKGTGQGLTIAHSIVVEKHGGTIFFETEVGRGTTFVIRLPMREQSAPSEVVELEELETIR